MKKLKPKKRSRRRGDMERMKARVRHHDRFTWNSWPAQPLAEPDPREVGVVARTRRACSCALCKFARYDRAAEKRSIRWDD